MVKEDALTDFVPKSARERKSSPRASWTAMRKVIRNMISVNTATASAATLVRKLLQKQDPHEDRVSEAMSIIGGS
jgi:hypothetical protein